MCVLYIRHSQIICAWQFSQRNVFKCLKWQIFERKQKTSIEKSYGAICGFWSLDLKSRTSNPSSCALLSSLTTKIVGRQLNCVEIKLCSLLKYVKFYSGELAGPSKSFSGDLFVLTAIAFWNDKITRQPWLKLNPGLELWISVTLFQPCFSFRF